MLKKDYWRTNLSVYHLSQPKKAKLLCEAFFPSPNKIRGMKTKKLGKIQFQVLKHNLAPNKKKKLFISFLLSYFVFFHPLFVLYIQCSRICFALYTLIICFGKIFFVLSVFKITLMLTNFIFCVKNIVILKSADFSIIMLV